MDRILIRRQNFHINIFEKSVGIYDVKTQKLSKFSYKDLFNQGLEYGCLRFYRWAGKEDVFEIVDASSNGWLTIATIYPERFFVEIY